MQRRERILVIKLSALGDFVLSIASFQAIRRAHPGAELTLLTTGPYRELAAAMRCFDRIEVDPRPKPWQAGTWISLIYKLRNGHFDRVYDLQRNERTSWYFNLLGAKKPEWVGVAPGCSHRYEPLSDVARHIVEREAEQLSLAGVERSECPDLSFVPAQDHPFGLPDSYALLVPGGAAHRPGKRWPASHYAEIARILAEDYQITPVLIGDAAEQDVIEEIRTAYPKVRDLSGETSLSDIAALARGAQLCIGNDTGPMHLMAAAGAPAISLFSDESDPIKVAPRGPSVTVLTRPNLADLPVDEVLAALPCAARTRP